MKLHKIIMEDIEDIKRESIEWEKLQNRTVLITGINGLIATYLTYVLLYLNDSLNLNIMILGIARNEMDSKKRYADLLERPDFRLIVQDVIQPISYIKEIHYIIHAASSTSPKAFVNDPVGTIKTNTIGTLNLLDLSLEKKCESFLYISTREIYGEPICEKMFVSENDYGIVNPILVRSCYPEGKRISETMCASYQHQFGISTKVARVAHTYGPGMVISDGRVVGDFIGNIIQRKDILLKSHGNSILDLTYISDTVKGIFFHLLNSNELVFNISANMNIITVRELAEKLQGMYRCRKLMVRTDLRNQKEENGYLKNKVAIPSANKIKMIGWKPSIGLEKGICRTIEYIEDTLKRNGENL